MSISDGMILLAIGLFSGVISGMGIGGGAILIPALYIFLNINQQSAQNINLIYFIPTAVIALVTHVKNKNIEKSVLPKIIIAGIPSAILGAFLATRTDNELLRKMFGGFLLVMGIMEFFKKEKKEKGEYGRKQIQRAKGGI